MRVRGLKLYRVDIKNKNLVVAPHAGAWIETNNPAQLLAMLCVAPHAGAWIETLNGGGISVGYCVAPHAGAWIETRKQGACLQT